MTELEATMESTADELTINIDEQITDGCYRLDGGNFEDTTLLAKLVRTADVDKSITEKEVRIIEALL